MTNRKARHWTWAFGLCVLAGMMAPAAQASQVNKKIWCGYASSIVEDGAAALALFDSTVIPGQVSREDFELNKNLSKALSRASWGLTYQNTRPEDAVPVIEDVIGSISKPDWSQLSEPEIRASLEALAARAMQDCDDERLSTFLQD
ncbi:MAG: hypothetical protein AAFO72_04515 [Pseudomonadota bacterium]